MPSFGWMAKASPVARNSLKPITSPNYDIESKPRCPEKTEAYDFTNL